MSALTVVRPAVDAQVADFGRETADGAGPRGLLTEELTLDLLGEGLLLNRVDDDDTSLEKGEHWPMVRRPQVGAFVQDLIKLSLRMSKSAAGI